MGIVKSSNDAGDAQLQIRKLSESELQKIAEDFRVHLGSTLFEREVLAITTSGTRFCAGQALADVQRGVKERVFSAPIYIKNLTEEVHVLSWENIHFLPVRGTEAQDGRVHGCTRYMSDGSYVSIPFGEPLLISGGESVAISVTCYSTSKPLQGMALKLAIRDEQTSAIVSSVEFVYGSANAFPKQTQEMVLIP